MAGDWLKVEKTTPSKPELMNMATQLQVSRADVFLACFTLWSWADSHSADGTIPRVPVQAVDDITRLPGFAQALIDVGWLHARNGSLQLPNFDRHMGQSAKQRVSGAERQRRHRSGNGRVTKRECISRPLRRQIHDLDDYTCVYCGWKKTDKPACAGQYVGVTLGLDHIIPVTRGGDDVIENLVSCCSLCNGTKNNRTPDEAGMKVTFVSQKRATIPLPEKRREEKSKTPLPPKTEEFFLRFWEVFPKYRKSGKDTARPAFAKACKKADPETIIAAAKEYAASPVGKGEFVKGPAPWLNGACWEDDREAWGFKPAARQRTLEEIAEENRRQRQLAGCEE